LSDLQTRARLRIIFFERAAIALQAAGAGPIHSVWHPGKWKLKKKRLIVTWSAAGLLLAGALMFNRFNPELFSLRSSQQKASDFSGYSGTQPCRECHEKFYQL